MESIANVKRIGYVGSQPTRGTVDTANDDWYTPSEWIEVARRILYGIDLDPFSSDLANQRVRANRYFTEESNALEQTWEAKTVWMNPPYTRGLIDKAVTKFISEYRFGSFTHAMVLVNNMTDTRWYRSLLSASSHHCNIMGRIGFENAAGQRISGNTRGQTLFLFSNTPQIISMFVKEMRKMDQIPLKKV